MPAGSAPASVAGSTPWVAAAAALPGQDRVAIELVGPDARRFAQGTFSADVNALEAAPGAAAIPSALLTVKGKLVSDGLLLARGDDALELWVPAELAETVAEQLDAHVVMDELEVRRVEGRALALAVGDEPPVLAGPHAQALECRPITYPVRGWAVIGPRDALGEWLSSAPGSVTGEAALARFAAARIATRVPAWAHEVGPDVFPPEVGFVAAVSYDKGCYLGQEPLSRLHLRGRANRGLVAVGPREGTVASIPVELADAEGPVGRLTTWAASAGADSATAAGLAIVHRRAFAPGTTLTTADGATVVVLDGPHGADPGVGARRR